MVAHRATPLYLLLLAVAALGAVVKRESSSGCLYQFVTQPQADILRVCNPFKQQSSLTLECSILVMDNKPGEVTIQWVHKEQLSREETVLSTSTTAHNQGDTITSNITVSATEMGQYFCRPNSSNVGPLMSSTKTEVLNRALYFGKDSCTGVQLSTQQDECALLNNSNNPTTEDETLTTPTTEPVTEAATPQPITTMSEVSSTRPGSTPTLSPHYMLYVALGGMGLLVIILVVCMVVMACYCYKRSRRNRKPKSKGRGSRVVRDWHAVNVRTNVLPSQRQQPSLHCTRAQLVPLSPPCTSPPVLDTSTGQTVTSPTPTNHLDSSTQYNEYSSNWIASYDGDRSEWVQLKGASSTSIGVKNRVAVERVGSTQSLPSVQSSSGTKHHSYMNYPPLNSNSREVQPSLPKPVQEEGIPTKPKAKRGLNEPRDERDRQRSQTSLPAVSRAQEEPGYSVVGNRGHIYQGLVPETMNYISLYHVVNRTSTE